MLDEVLSLSMAPDIAIAATMLALLILYGTLRGTGLLLSIALSLPIAGFLYTIFPYHLEVSAVFPANVAPFASLVLFGLFVLLVLWILQRTIGPASGSGRPLHIITTAAALTVLLLTFSYHIVPIEGIYDFGSVFDDFFGSTTNFFWVTMLALLALFVV